jgi:hypothetical protein
MAKPIMAGGSVFPTVGKLYTRGADGDELERFPTIKVGVFAMHGT